MTFYILVKRNRKGSSRAKSWVAIVSRRAHPSKSNGLLQACGSTRTVALRRAKSFIKAGWAE